RSPRPIARNHVDRPRSVLKHATRRRIYGRKAAPPLIDLLVETHIDLERQGPGSTETTLKALGFLDHPERMANAADLGCGSGPQTLELARHLPGTIVGVDMFPAFIDKLNQNARRQGVADRVKG